MNLSLLMPSPFTDTNTPFSCPFHQKHSSFGNQLTLFSICRLNNHFFWAKLWPNIQWFYDYFINSCDRLIYGMKLLIQWLFQLKYWNRFCILCIRSRCLSVCVWPEEETRLETRRDWNRCDTQTAIVFDYDCSVDDNRNLLEANKSPNDWSNASQSSNSAQVCRSQNIWQMFFFWVVIARDAEYLFSER